MWHGFVDVLAVHGMELHRNYANLRRGANMHRDPCMAEAARGDWPT